MLWKSKGLPIKNLLGNIYSTFKAAQYNFSTFIQAILYLQLSSRQWCKNVNVVFVLFKIQFLHDILNF